MLGQDEKDTPSETLGLASGATSEQASCKMGSIACVPVEEDTSAPAGENADRAGAEASTWPTYVGASLRHHSPCTAGASGTTMLLCDATDWRPSVHQRYLTGRPLRHLASRL